MAQLTQPKGGKKNRKFGRNTQKCARYRQEHRREKNKLRRILRSNGEAAARKYGLTTYLNRLVQGRTA